MAAFYNEMEVFYGFFSQLQSPFFRPLWSLSALVWVSGASSTCLKATATTTPARMLIYGKEATTQIENSVPYYSVSKWSSNTKMLLLHFHAP